MLLLNPPLLGINFPLRCAFMERLSNPHSGSLPSCRKFSSKISSQELGYHSPAIGYDQSEIATTDIANRTPFTGGKISNNRN